MPSPCCLWSCTEGLGCMLQLACAIMHANRRPRACHTSNMLCCTQATENWGYWGMIRPGVDNGQSRVALTDLKFSRPAEVANKYRPNEGFTGLV